MNINHRTLGAVTYSKRKNGWIVTDEIESGKFTCQLLLEDLISKKLNGCRYIKSIKNVYNYDGTRTITVYYFNTDKQAVDIKREYTIPSNDLGWFIND